MAWVDVVVVVVQIFRLSYIDKPNTYIPMKYRVIVMVCKTWEWYRITNIFFSCDFMVFWSFMAMYRDSSFVVYIIIMNNCFNGRPLWSVYIWVFLFLPCVCTVLLFVYMCVCTCYKLCIYSSFFPLLVEWFFGLFLSLMSHHNCVGCSFTNGVNSVIEHFSRRRVGLVVAQLHNLCRSMSWWWRIMDSNLHSCMGTVWATLSQMCYCHI